MASFNLENYETVEDRLVKFWNEHKDGRVLTSVHYYDDNRILVRAEIYFNREDDRPVATGYAEELRGASPVNRTSHAENAETSAIGRGLANCGYATKGSRPSREEMQKVQRMGSAPAPVKSVSVQPSDPLVSMDNIKRFVEACKSAGLNHEQIAKTAKVDLADLKESQMPALREAFAKAKDLAAQLADTEPEVMDDFNPAFKNTEEAVAAVINMFSAEEVIAESKANHPANGSPQIKEPGAPATAKQIGMFRALASGKGIATKAEQLSMASDSTGRVIESLEALTKSEISELITILKA